MRNLTIVAVCVIALGNCAADTDAIHINAFPLGDQLMVSISEVLPPLGFRISWTPKTDRMKTQSNATALSFTVGGTETTRTDKATGAQAAVTMPEPMQFAGYLLHAPIPAIFEALGLPCEKSDDPAARGEYIVAGRPVSLRVLPKDDKLALDLASGSVVKLATTKGNIYLDLFETATPITTGNFIDLVTRGFYDGIAFHRVIADFMIQGGCPLGNGLGGPGYTIPDEADRGLKHYRGSLSMAKTAAPNTGGSQFFICHTPQPHLDGVHTVFGRCIGGMDVVDSIRQGDTIRTAQLLFRSGNADAAVAEALQARIPNRQ